MIEMVNRQSTAMSFTTADSGAGHVEQDFLEHSLHVQDDENRCFQEVKTSSVQDEEKTTVKSVKETLVHSVKNIFLQEIKKTFVQDVTSTLVQDVTSTNVQEVTSCSKCVKLNQTSARRNNTGMTLRACCALLVALLATTHHVACAPRPARSVYGIRPGPAPPQPPADLEYPDYYTDPIIEKLPEYEVLPQHRLLRLSSRQKPTVLIDMMQQGVELKHYLREDLERRLERKKEERQWQQMREEQRQQIDQVNNEDLKDKEEIYFNVNNISPEKRGSYMAICHFKVCNMGRKRNFE